MKMESAKLRPDMQSIIDQFVTFRIQYCTLESKFRSLQEEHRLEIADITLTNAEQNIRMEEEIEILRSQLAGMEELHREEIARIEKRKEMERLNFKKTIDILKTKINELQTALDKNIQLTSHPALRKSNLTNRSIQKKSATSNFKWPSLDVNSSSTSKPLNTKNTTANKKRKLYTIDEEAVVDITLMD